MVDITKIKELITVGDLHQLKIEIEKGFDINTRLEDEANMLHYAAQLGQNKIVSFLIDSGLDVNSRSSRKVTPLHMAVDNGELSTVKLLLESGAGIDCQDEDGYQPIHTACFSSGTSEILQYLINNGADVNAKINRGSVALNIAVENNMIDLVEILIAHGADVNNVDETEFTPLYYAIKRDRGEILSLLIKSGANISHRVSEDITPLIYCVKGNKTTCIEPLIKSGYNYREEINGESPFHSAAISGYGYVLQKGAEAGIDLNFKDSKGKTMLDYALENENEFAMKTLLKAGVKLNEDQLKLAAGNGDYNSIVKLVESFPETVFENKITLFHLIIREEEPELLEELLNKTTKTIDFQDAEGNTALHYATYAYDQKFFHLLLEAGADPRIINNKGNNIINRINPDMTSESILLLKDYPELFTHRGEYQKTPIEYAMENGYCKSYPAFAQIHYEMNDTKVYSKGFTPIQMAAALGCKEPLDQLVETNQLNNINEDKNNLLWFLLPLEAYDKENSRITRLVNAGIDINNINKEGLTPLMQASIKGFSWAREALLKNGADTSIADKTGKTPLHVVTSKGRKSAIKELLEYGANPDIKDNEGVTPRDLANEDDEIKELFSNY